MRAFLTAVLVMTLTGSAVFAKSLDEMFPGAKTIFTDQAYQELSVIDYQQGQISIGNGLATIDTGTQFYFLGAEDANYVLSTLWGNPPSPETLGMLFPADQSPLDDSWGIEIYFDEIGYVSDTDAEGYDYDNVLRELRRDQVENNRWRQQNGYVPIELVGWASPPRYDQSRRSLYWAKEYSFADQDFNTLNYNIRMLGRRGVLVLNFIAGMDHLQTVDRAVPAVIAATTFSDGNRYSDFDPSVDTVAAVGIGGLIAGKVLTKTGFLAVALLFLKKFWFVLLLPLFWLKNVIFPRKD